MKISVLDLRLILAEAMKSNRKITLEDFSTILAKMEELGGKWDIDEGEIFKVEKNGNISVYDEIFFDGDFVHYKIEIVGYDGEVKLTEKATAVLF